MTAPNAIQTQPLTPVPSGIDVLIVNGLRMSQTWNKWMIDLREKVNTLNAALAEWSGITPQTGLTAGTYGDATHYPKITFDKYGRATNVVLVTVPTGTVITTITGPAIVAGGDVAPPATPTIYGRIVISETTYYFPLYTL